MITQKTYPLSKTLYCKGKNCAKALWLYFHKSEVSDKIDSYRRRLFDYGHSVGKRATQSFKDGILIDVPREQGEEALLRTQEAFHKNPPAIFEGAFKYKDVLVRVDILENNFDGTWNLLEVKSSSHLKPNPHFDDVAIQKWVLVGTGIVIKNSFVMLPTRGFTPNTKLDSSGKFVLHAVDTQIESHIEIIEKNLNAYQTQLNSMDEPEARTGDHCKRPYLCEFKSYCWKRARALR